MKKYMILGMILLLISIPCVMAGVGLLKIDPSYPTTTASPADFTVWCQSGSSYDVEILVVMTDECYLARTTDTGVVTVDYGGSTIVTFDKNDFTSVTGMGGVYVPDSGATTGARYTVASLKDHLDYGLSTALESDDKIWWDMKPLGVDFDPLNTAKVITVTLNSDDPRMLVYLMGRGDDSGVGDLDMAIPPTMAGFIVPEVVIGSIMAVASMFTALGLYAYKKKQTPKQ